MRKNMKKMVALLLAIVTMTLMCCGCGNEEKVVGTWKGLETDATLTFYETGTGYYQSFGRTGFTWEVKDDIVYLHMEDNRSSYSYTLPVTGKHFEGTSGSAAHTDSYRLQTNSSPYKLEAIDAFWDYEKVN